jgi:hypothetical protein
MTKGLGAAILCLLLAALGYGVVLVAERARDKPGTLRLPSRTPQVENEDAPRRAEELNRDLGHVYEPSDDASSPLASEVDYGWPTEEPQIAHTNGR